MNFQTIIFNKIDSTNSYAKTSIKNKTISGNGIILAKYQTAGRGRNSKIFQSNNNSGIWATLFFTNSEISAFKLVAKTSVAIILSLQKFELDSYIKWPNDIEINRQKICGILAESFDNSLIIGFGINMRQKKEDFAEKLQKRATSLFIETGKIVSNSDFLDSFYEIFFSLDNWNELFLKYTNFLGIKNKLMFLNTKKVNIIGVEKDGAILIKTDSKTTKKVYSGSLSWE